MVVKEKHLQDNQQSIPITSNQIAMDTIPLIDLLLMTDAGDSRIGASRLDGNGGPYLQDNTSNAYGCENRNGGDAVNDFFWGGATNTSTTSYGFYFCIKKYKKS